MSSEIHSRPKYSGLTPDASAKSHLIVAEEAGCDAVIDLFGMASSTFRSNATVLYCASSSHSKGLTERMSNCAIRTQAFASGPELLESLRDTLASASMGLRLYVAGKESFIGSVAIVAHGFGVSYESMRTEHRGSLARRVQCVHCKEIAEDITTNFFQCSRCGILLFVRDHYSRRIGAFMGVASSVEDPTEQFPIMEIYP